MAFLRGDFGRRGAVLNLGKFLLKNAKNLFSRAKRQIFVKKFRIFAEIVLEF